MSQNGHCVVTISQALGEVRHLRGGEHRALLDREAADQPLPAYVIGRTRSKGASPNCEARAGWRPGADGAAVRAGHGRAGDREGDVHQPGQVRDVLHIFNADGFQSLLSKYGGGRPPKFTLPQRQQITKTGLARPTDHGLPFSTWSCPSWRTSWSPRVVDDIGHEGLRALLREKGVSFQAVKTWEDQHRSGLRGQEERVLELYAIADGGTPPRPGDPTVVVCMNEFGRLNLQPHPGKQWAPQPTDTGTPSSWHATAGSVSTSRGGTPSSGTATARAGSSGGCANSTCAHTRLIPGARAPGVSPTPYRYARPPLPRAQRRQAGLQRNQKLDKHILIYRSAVSPSAATSPPSRCCAAQSTAACCPRRC